MGLTYVQLKQAILDWTENDATEFTKATGSVPSQARTKNSPVLVRANLHQSTSPKAGKCENSMVACRTKCSAENIS